MAYTVGIGGRCICKALSLDDAMKFIKQELADIEKNDEVDVHIWREH